MTSSPICKLYNGRCWLFLVTVCSAAIPSCLHAVFNMGNCDHMDLSCNICIGDLDVLARGVMVNH